MAGVPVVLAHQSEQVTLYHAQCQAALEMLPDASVDAVVTDPPYGLSREPDMAEVMRHWLAGDDYTHTGNGFMGKTWDSFVPGPAVWRECFRVLKPGGHLLSFAGSRTQDLMGLAIRLAGFEIRDSIAWLYGSGFPKSLDVSKAIDKAAGAEREIVGTSWSAPKLAAGQGVSGLRQSGSFAGEYEGERVGIPVTAPATEAAQQWQGWGTTLKPAFEPVVVARKPIKGTVAANVLQHGTGALNIDACRVGDGEDRVGGGPRPARQATGGFNMSDAGDRPTGGRWPTNVVLDDSQAAALDEQSGHSVSRGTTTRGGHPEKHRVNDSHEDARNLGRLRPQGKVSAPADSGGASRFFPVFKYQAKAPAKERPKIDGVSHPTVKPLEFMRWLVKLVTPPGGTVLEPFAGSGTTVEACLLEGFRCVAIEREADYLPLIMARLERNGIVDDLL